MTDDVARLNEAIRRRFRHSLALRAVSAGDCGGCRGELAAAFGPIHELAHLGVDLVVSPRHADALVVAGPVTAAGRDALLRTYEALPEPRLVIALGDCALTGGVFAGAPGVCGPLAEVIPVDVRIPGCPPAPRAIIAALIAALAG